MEFKILFQKRLKIFRCETSEISAIKKKNSFRIFALKSLAEISVMHTYIVLCKRGEISISKSMS